MLLRSQREHVLATSHQATRRTRRQDQEDFAVVLEIPRSTGRFLLPEVKALKHGSRVRRTRNLPHPVLYPGRTPRSLAMVAIAVMESRPCFSQTLTPKLSRAEGVGLNELLGRLEPAARNRGNELGRPIAK